MGSGICGRNGDVCGRGCRLCPGRGRPCLIGSPQRVTGPDSVANTPESMILSEVALFRGLPAEQVSKIEARLRRKTLPAGAHVITAEDPGETVYVVLEGSEGYVTRPDWSEVILAILGAGEIVGEMSLADSLDARLT